MFGIQKLRIASVAIIAVLLLLMPTVQTVSQQPAGALSRERIANGLNTAFSAILQASGEGIQLAAEKAVFLSEFKGTIAFVPLHHTYWSRALDLLIAMLAEEKGSVPIGGLYVGKPIKAKGLYEEGPGFSLPQGVYLLRLAVDKVIVVDKEGNTLGTLTAEIKIPGRHVRPVIRTDQVGQFLMVQIDTPWIGPLADAQMDIAPAGGLREFLAGVGTGLVLGALLLLI